VNELLGMLKGKLDVYETILGKQKYLAGDVRLMFISCTLAMK